MQREYVVRGKRVAIEELEGIKAILPMVRENDDGRPAPLAVRAGAGREMSWPRRQSPPNPKVHGGRMPGAAAARFV